MKLLFDGYWLVNGPPSGKTVVREIVQAWCQAFPEDEILLLVRHVDRPLVEELDIVKSHGIVLLETLVPIHGLAVMTMRIPRDVDAVVTQNFTPLAPHSATKATFLHDGIYKQYPAWFTVKERIYLSLATLSLRFANVVMTSTLTESNRIQKYFSHTRSKTRAVGLGIPSWVTAGKNKTDVRASRLKPYVLAVGRLNIRKNLRALVDAFESSVTLQAEFDLLIVGEPNGKTASTGTKSSSVHFLSGIDDASLSDLYAGASAFVFPSLDEGFGLPLLEAASFRIPIAASDIDVFREIDLADIYFDPRDTKSIADALLKLTTIGTPVHDEEPKPRIKRALSKYNWTNVTSNIRTTLEKVGRS